MVKICHMTSVHNAKDDRIFEKECTSLAKSSDCIVYLIATNTNNFRVNNVNIMSAGTRSEGRFKRFFCTAKNVYLKAVKLNADIYHIHDPELFRYAKKLKKLGKIVIIDSHEHYALQILQKNYIPKYLRKFASNAYLKYETSLFKLSDAVIVPIPAFGKYNYNNRSNKVVYLNNYPSLDSIVNQYDSIKIHRGKSACYTGGLSKSRGIINIVKACSKAGVKLILAGPFDSEEFKSEIEGMEEWSNVDYRGVCTREEVLSIYNESSVGLNVLMNVGQYANVSNLSTKVYEYMSFELPVIINSYSYGDMLISKYAFGVSVNPENIDEIVDAISELINNIDIARSMGRRGRALVAEKFNWGIEEKKLYSLYNELLEDNNIKGRLSL